MNDYGIVLFYTSSAALRGEKIVTRAGLKAKLVPTPRHLSSDCGIALRFDWPAADAVRRALQEAHVPVEGIHPPD